MVWLIEGWWWGLGHLRHQGSHTKNFKSVLLKCVYKRTIKMNTVPINYLSLRKEEAQLA